jgi:NAD(P)-dependent dehydrogenase (short-subunit alcohol dehydrogenase family)
VETLGAQSLAAVVHAAGISPSMGTAARIFAVNLDGAARLVEAIRDRMAPGSAAVLFASNSSYFPMPQEAAAAVCRPLPAEGAVSLAHLAESPEIAYPLSKLGVRALVKREAKAFGARGARLVSMSPGAIDTAMTRGEPSDIATRMVETSASGRMGRPEELAAVAVFLCSPDASFVTGVDWLVDGGHTAALGF